MIVYDGTYRMQPDANQGLKPRTRWKFAWRVRIINLRMAQPDVQHIRPMILIAKQSGLAISLSSCAESIGKKIRRDFNLDVSQVLWVEHFPNKPRRWHVAAFSPKSASGPYKNYNVRWRPIRPNELDLIKAFIPNIDDNS